MRDLKFDEITAVSAGVDAGAVWASGLSGFGTGMGLGAGIGTAFFPGAGTLIGGLIGGGIGTGVGVYTYFSM